MMCQLKLVYMFAAFTDFQKAFDSVLQDYLWQKVEGLGMHGPFIGTLKPMYSRVLSSVQVNDKLSDWFSVGIGVKQGCLLSPALFIQSLAYSSRLMI